MKERCVTNLKIVLQCKTTNKHHVITNLKIGNTFMCNMLCYVVYNGTVKLIALY